MTAGAFIIRKEKGKWLCLVHMHKKIDVLMQIGGHIELDQTPWQALVVELREEAGYDLSELKLLQYSKDTLHFKDAIVHPVPLLENTHYVGNAHYHSDRVYAFVAADTAKSSLAEGESTDLRWLSVEDLRRLSQEGKALQDVVEIYDYILAHLDEYFEVDPMLFSLAKPKKGVTYKR